MRSESASAAQIKLEQAQHDLAKKQAATDALSKQTMDLHSIYQEVSINQVLIGRLIDLDKLAIEHPDVLIFIETYKDRTDALSAEFLGPTTDIGQMHCQMRAKYFILVLLNVFDEYFMYKNACTMHDGLVPGNKPAAISEVQDWDRYIRDTMHKPIFWSLFDATNACWGLAFRDYMSNQVVRGKESNHGKPVPKISFPF